MHFEECYYNLIPHFPIFIIEVSYLVNYNGLDGKLSEIMLSWIERVSTLCSECSIRNVHDNVIQWYLIY